MILGDCYESAGKFMMDEHFMGNDNLVLVHGMVTGTGGEVEGKKYGHAWVESKNGKTVFDHANGKNVKVDKKLYYTIGNINKTYKYTYKEMAHWVTKTGHWGNWE